MSRRGAAVRLTLAGFVRKLAEPQETAFEKFVRENEIPECVWKASPVLRQWVKRHASYKYVPEYLLETYGIQIREPERVAQ